MTWPSDQDQGRDYAKLVESVNISSSEPSGDDAKNELHQEVQGLAEHAYGEG